MISPTHTLAPEWQNENALRAYPIMEDSPAAGVIPTWLISDLKITVDVNCGTVFISSVYVSETLISVSISSRVEGKPAVGLLTRTVTRDELEADKLYSLYSFGNAAGAIAFGTPPASVAPFKYTFNAAEAPIAPSAIVRTRMPGVTHFIDEDRDITVDGIIDLSGNNEFRTSRDTEDPQTIVITLADAYRDLVTSVCNKTPSLDACGATPVKTINGVPPDETGNITIRFT